MFEHKGQSLLPRKDFLRRMFRCGLWSGAILAAALGVGMSGYHFFEKMDWVDSFANASMILSGMGPLSNLQTNAGKLFAGFYAMFSGLVFLTAIGIVAAPLAHRALHKFHLERGKEKGY